MTQRPDSTPVFYSADRRGFYTTGSLALSAKDPRSGAQPFLNSGDGWFTADDIATHVAAQFMDGLSLHGWEWMTWRSQTASGSDGQMYTHHERAIELLFEYVRRSAFPNCPSRLQSFFAFDNIEDARAFADGKPIYKLTADRFFKADQQWLKLSEQNGIASFYAHKYWEGTASPTPRWEYLLVPPISTEHVENAVQHDA